MTYVGNAPLPPEVLAKPWWKWAKDVNVWIGIAGLLIGLGTYWFSTASEDREYRERVRAARAEIITAVSRSIGEGVVPDRDKIGAVIRSARRSYGIKESHGESVDSVVDDIIARVLSNEFLDSKRREELSAALIAVQTQGAQSSRTGATNPASEQQSATEPEPLQQRRSDNVIFSLVMMTIAMGGMLLIVAIIKRTTQFNRPVPLQFALVIALLLASLLSYTVLRELTSNRQIVRPETAAKPQ